MNWQNALGITASVGLFLFAMGTLLGKHLKRNRERYPQV